MKAFSEPCRRQIGRLASSFSLRRSAPRERGGRAQPDRYPDFGLQTSLPPSHPSRVAVRTVAVGVRGPLQWRDRSRFSRDSLTPDCFSADDSPADFKERFLDTLALAAFQAKTLRITKIVFESLKSPTQFGVPGGPWNFSREGGEGSEVGSDYSPSPPSPPSPSSRDMAECNAAQFCPA